MITLQLPPAAAKQVQPATAAAPANPANAVNPAAGDADPGVAAKEPSLFAFLLAQQNAAAGAGAIPGADKAATTDEAGKEDAATDAKAGDPAAGAPWMWLNSGLPREITGTAAKATVTAETTPDSTEAVAGATSALPGTADAKLLSASQEAAPGQTTGVTHKGAPDEFATPVTTTEAAPQHTRIEMPAPQTQSASQATQAAPAPKAAPVEVPIESKVGTPRWTRDIHQSVSMLVQARTSVAELRLTPADMGPIQIRIDFSEKQPSVSISVQQADTRNALDAALPRLRDMMAESGITLGGAGVEQHGRPGDAPGEQARFAWQGRDESSRPPVPAADQFIPAARPVSLDQLVDTYA